MTDPVQRTWAAQEEGAVWRRAPPSAGPGPRGAGVATPVGGTDGELRGAAVGAHLVSESPLDQIHVGRIEVDPDPPSPQHLGGYDGGSRPGKRIKDGLARVAGDADASCSQIERHRSGG